MGWIGTSLLCEDSKTIGLGREAEGRPDRLRESEREREKRAKAKAVAVESVHSRRRSRRRWWWWWYIDDEGKEREERHGAAGRRSEAQAAKEEEEGEYLGVAAAGPSIHPRTHAHAWPGGREARAAKTHTLSMVGMM